MDECECGEPLDTDCMGNTRCPICDPPCPHCYDGGGPEEDFDDDDFEVGSNEGCKDRDSCLPW